MKQWMVGAAVAAMMSLSGLVSPLTARAQTVPLIGTYLAGWNLVGGPPGTAWPAAQATFSYSNGAYSSGMAGVSGCAGFWAYYAAPTTVTLDPNATPPSQTCPLQAGWNLIGNPFSGIAALPGNSYAFSWDPAAGQYHRTTSIQPGAADWVYADAPGSLTMAFVPVAQSPPPPTVDIDNLTNPGPFTLHVGETVRLLLPSAFPEEVTTDSSYLRLLAAGVTGPLSCIGDPTCALSLVNQFWTYRALMPGTTSLEVTPQCRRLNPPCATPTVQITIVIQP